METVMRTAVDCCSYSIRKHVDGTGDEDTFFDTTTLRAGTDIDFSSPPFGYLYSIVARFEDIDIPPESVINSASISVRVFFVRDVDLVIRSWDEANPPGLPTDFLEASSAELTTAADRYTEHIDSTPITLAVASSVQEKVSQLSWAAGDAVNFDISPYETDPTEALDGGMEQFSGSISEWVLEIDFTPPNTAPEFTVSPTVSYQRTRLGPASTASVEFTAVDNEDTGTDDLTWEIRTAASGGGTLVETGSCTSGVSENASITNSSSGISEGSNTLYLRVGDGSLWSDDESFTLLCDRTSPTVGAITHSPDPVTES